MVFYKIIKVVKVRGFSEISPLIGSILVPQGEEGPVGPAGPPGLEVSALCTLLVAHFPQIKS